MTIIILLTFDEKIYYRQIFNSLRSFSMSLLLASIALFIATGKANTYRIENLRGFL